jgi:hypothetical protein
MKQQIYILASIVLFAIFFNLGVVNFHPLNVEAQEEGWRATILLRSETGVAIQTVNANGVIDTIPVSAQLLVENTTGSSIFITSPDGRYILHKYYVQGDTSAHLRFGATGDGACCTEVSDLVGDISEYSLAGFEPTGSRFALSYVRAMDDTPFFAGGMMVIDAANATVIADISMDEAVSGMAVGEPPAWARMGRWTADGIQFIGTCFACGGGYVEGHYLVWNPDTDAIVADSGVAVSDFGATLEGTGEFIYRGLDNRFLHDPSPGVYPIPNVIQYFATGNLADKPVPIYTDADQYNIAGMSWVGDGQAVLILSPSADYWDIVFRSGRVERIQETDQPRFMGGTPDGWFAAITLDGNRAIAHYSIETLEPTVIVSLDDATSAQFTYFPPLGQNVVSEPFMAITPPDVAYTARCPDSLPARLVAGQSAAVLPGSPNRIREYPGEDGEIIGEIPSGATFSVVSGPSCDGTSITWWFVEYDGVRGWTAEGVDDTYFVAPVAQG